MLVLHPSVCIEKELDILSQSMTVNRSQFSRDVKNIPVNLSRSTDISIKISPSPKGYFKIIKGTSYHEILRITCLLDIHS